MSPDPTTDRAAPGRGRGNISRWSIEHPYIVVAFYLGVAVLSALVIFFQMPRRMMPYVESPMVAVVSMMPGLSAEEMEIYFSKPIEERMVDLKNVHFVRSTSQEAFSIVTVEFWYGTDMKKALFDIQSLMNVVQADLPMTGSNLKPSWVLPIDPLNIPVLSLAVTAEGYDRVQLRTLVENEVVNRLKGVKNVYSVVPFGGQKLQMQVIVDRERLAAYKMTLLDLKGALDMQNVSRPAGTLTYQDRELLVRSDFRARAPEEVAGYPIASTEGRTVYLRDVAEVMNAPREQRSLYRLNGKEAVEVSVIQQPDASSVQVIKDVKAKLEEIRQDFPRLRFETAYDNGTFVGFLLDNMVEELVVAVLLTGIVVLFFLGNIRGTLISVITIPVSLGMALLAMVPFGMTLNSSTLIGLLLSIGRLVDDSIIDIHSIERHLRMGKSPKEAAIDGISEVRLAVLAITFMLCVALLPLAFSGGIVQYMFEGIVWAIILALLSSALVSFTLTALLAAHLFAPHSEEAERRRTWFERGLIDPFQRFLERLEARYRGGLAWSIRNRFTVFMGAAALILAGVALYPRIGSEMMPLADVSQAFVQLEAAPGTSFARTSEIAAEVERLLLKQPEVVKVSSEVGFEPGGTYFTGYSMGSVNSAFMMVTLVDSSKRNRNIWQVVDQVRNQAMGSIPGIRRLAIKEMGADVMASSAAPIQVIFFGPDLEKLSEIGEQARRLAEEIPGFYQVTTSWAQTLPQLHVVVDRARAQEIGLSVADVADQAYYALKGGLTNEFYRLDNKRQFTILVRYRGDQRRDQGDLEQVKIVGKKGEVVPLSSVARIEERRGPTLIEHDNFRRVVSVLGFYRKGGPSSMELSMDLLMAAHEKINFPPGYGVELRGDMTQMEESFQRLLRGLYLALIFMFLLLVAQFRSLIEPFNMIFSLSLILTGILGGLLLAHQTFSTVSILAVVILTGMMMTVAVLMIDLVLRLRAEGMERDEAILTAGPIRLRPILMTSLISIVVLIPVAFFPRTGIDAYAPLATVVIGGLTMGTVLALFVVPVLHTYTDDLTKLAMAGLRRLRGRGIEHGGTNTRRDP
ncbi:MAG: efflux RND transporter permease subunit [Candidatus Rokubacteria bacterium]|nr:efflux RND transporter permease subunit [Candidatus Rokubacteria bacterium]